MKISEVSKAFDIPTETLRFIEQQGLVHPKRNEENGYREYDLQAFSELVEYMKLRRLGLPVRTIIDLSHGDTLDRLVTELEGCACQLRHEVDSKQMLMGFLDDYRRKLTSVRFNLGVICFEVRPDFVYVDGGTGNGDVYTYHDTALVTTWRKAVPYVFLGCRGSIDSLLANHWITQWMFLTEKRYAERLQLPDGELIQRQLCLITFVNYMNWHEIRATCSEMIAFGKMHGYEPEGELQLIQLVRNYEPKGKSGYLAQMIMPVRKTLQ